MKLQVLQKQLEEMEFYVKHNNFSNSAVSKASVGWHLAHNLKVIHSICSAIKISDPDQYRKKFNWKKELVYFTGKIPRGKARAPRAVVPENNFSSEELQEQISRAHNEVNQISSLSKNAFFEHPYFGHIRRDETTKFLVIHTGHHLKIIRDILGVKTK